MPGVRDGVVKDGTNNLLLMHRPVRSLSLKDAKASNFMFCLMLLMTGPLVWICTLYTSSLPSHPITIAFAAFSALITKATSHSPGEVY